MGMDKCPRQVILGEEAPGSSINLLSLQLWKHPSFKPIFIC